MSDIKIALAADADNPDVGDIWLENGTARLTNSLAEEVAQSIRISLLLFKGEWFLDRAQGVPWWQSILGVKKPVGIVQQILRNAITQIPGVKNINAFVFKLLPSRAASLEFSVLLTNGVILKSSDYAPFIVGPG